MPVVALISDLMMQSQVGGAALRVGVELQIAGSESQLIEKAAAGDVGLVLVDLSHPGINPERVMQQLKPLLSEAVRTVAFGPHVHKLLLEAAIAAGFDAVLSRGQFHSQMDQVLAGCF
jgi:DNA-binding NarL/FixJ family response regulator